MATVDLSTRDINVLEKIKDPESNPAAGIILDSSLPRDPHVADANVYERVVAKEKSIIQQIQKIERELYASRTQEGTEFAVTGYERCLTELDSLVSEHPTYASARNNRAQIARRLYGDAMLMDDISGMPAPLIPSPERAQKLQSAAQALRDMDISIDLLTPDTAHTPVSPQAARTLSMAHTQRAAIYMRTAKLLGSRSLEIDDGRREARWSKLDFEEAASRDLALGGRYGNEIAKGLAVSANPTAKLCGEMVREAMKKEYGPAYAV